MTSPAERGTANTGGSEAEPLGTCESRRFEAELHCFSGSANAMMVTPDGISTCCRPSNSTLIGAAP